MPITLNTNALLATLFLWDLIEMIATDPSIGTLAKANNAMRKKLRAKNPHFWSLADAMRSLG